ncbi:hypothetical protein B0H13DRAFT_1894798 [Mycena leptocephala]|nr:hypothetical protein B0H13DRAFT_1894798 [Mycena leptocephala]
MPDELQQRYRESMSVRHAVTFAPSVYCGSVNLPNSFRKGESTWNRLFSHESSQYRPDAMSSTGPPSSTWNGEEAGELQKGKSLSPARRLIPRIIIASFFLVILAAVIVTGVLFNKSLKKTEDRHSLKGCTSFKFLCILHRRHPPPLHLIIPQKPSN